MHVPQVTLVAMLSSTITLLPSNTICLRPLPTSNCLYPCHFLLRGGCLPYVVAPCFWPPPSLFLHIFGELRICSGTVVHLHFSCHFHPTICLFSNRKFFWVYSTLGHHSFVVSKPLFLALIPSLLFSLSPPEVAIISSGTSLILLWPPRLVGDNLKFVVYSLILLWFTRVCHRCLYKDHDICEVHDPVA